MEKKFSRQELYELVWSKSLLALSKDFNISDVGLRKLCTRMDIPVPRRGHWQKVLNGNASGKKPLSNKYSGDLEVRLELRQPGSGGTTGFQSPLTILYKQILSDASLPLIVPDRLSTKDELIAGAKQNLTEKRYRPYNGIISSSGANLDITVSPKNLSRALRFMAALIAHLKLRGHSMQIEDHRTYAIVEGQQVQLALREKSERVEEVKSWEDGSWRPTGILSLQMKQSYHTMEAKDGTVLLEGQLAKILAKIELKGIEERKRREHFRKIREEEEARAKIEKERRQREEKELEDFKALIRKAQRWQKTRLIREYVNELKESNASSEWVEWAEVKCNWYDPRIESEDALLSDIDRDTLAPKKRHRWPLTGNPEHTNLR